MNIHKPCFCKRMEYYMIGRESTNNFVKASSGSQQIMVKVDLTDLSSHIPHSKCGQN